MSESRILIAGLPSSGKSTYVGLLFTSIEAGQGQLRLTNFSGDFQYVNALADRLSQCEEAIRTDINLIGGFNAELTGLGQESIDLRLPDYSGETWKTAMEARGWSDPVEEDVRDSSGVCLFIKVGQLINDGTIRDARRHAASLGEELDDTNEAGAAGVVPDQAKQTTQLALVDLLQVLTGRRRLRSSCRLAVVLSAFDLAGDVTPADWLRLNLPLLDQYLRANRHDLETSVYGVSGQGGRFDKAESKAELIDRPILDRAFVRNQEGQTVSIEDPILWVAGIEPANG